MNAENEPQSSAPLERPELNEDAYVRIGDLIQFVRDKGDLPTELAVLGALGEYEAYLQYQAAHASRPTQNLAPDSGARDTL